MTCRDGHHLLSQTYHKPFFQYSPVISGDARCIYPGQYIRKYVPHERRCHRRAREYALRPHQAEPASVSKRYDRPPPKGSVEKSSPSLNRPVFCRLSARRCAQDRSDRIWASPTPLKSSSLKPLRRTFSQAIACICLRQANGQGHDSCLPGRLMGYA